MPKDILDIVDTAVKIGLGAIVGGVTTYIMSEKQFRHQKLMKISDENRALTISIAEDFDKAGKPLNEIVVETRKYLYKPDNKEFNVEHISSLLIESANSVGRAKSKANLLGMSDLCSKLDILFTEFNNMLNHVEEFGRSTEKIGEFQEKWTELKAHHDAIYPLITTAFNSTNA